MPHDIINAISDISILLEHSNHNTSCIIDYRTYKKWNQKTLQTLVSIGIIKKNKSKKLDEIQCSCYDSPTLPLEHHNGKISASCFECGNIINIKPSDLILYNTRSKYIANFLAKQIDDIDKAKVLKPDQAFFAGETSEDLLIYFISRCQHSDINELCLKCKNDQINGEFIVLSTFIPNNLKKEYIALSIYEKKIWNIEDGKLDINIDFLEKKFLKNSNNSRSAKIRWNQLDKAKEKILNYLNINCQKLKMNNHTEITELILKDKSLIEYKNNKNKKTLIRKTQVSNIVKKYLKDKNMEFRVYGHKSYNDDKNTWYYKEP